MAATTRKLTVGDDPARAEALFAGPADASLSDAVLPSAVRETLDVSSVCVDDDSGLAAVTAEVESE